MRAYMEGVAQGRDPAAVRLAAAWQALCAHLARRRAELDAEVRAYPRPISRCDAQLPGLLDDRQRAVRALAAAMEVKIEVGDAMARAAVTRFLCDPPVDGDDRDERRLRAAVASALVAEGALP